MRRRSSIGIVLGAVIAGAGALWVFSRPDGGPHAESRVAEAKPARAPPPELAAQPMRPAGASRGDPIAMAPPAPLEAVEPERGEPRAKGEAKRVRVKAGDAPIQGAVVRARLAGDDLRPLLSVTTDATGLASLDPSILASRAAAHGPRTDDGFVYEAFAPGFRVASTDGNRFSETDDGVLEFDLEKGVPLDGRVVDAVTSAPIVGASVVVTDWSERFEFGPTDEQGAFHVSAVMNDNAATIVASAPGRVAATLLVRVDSGKPQPAEALLRLAPGGAIVGTVHAADGTPAPGALVRVLPQRDAGPADAAVDDAPPTSGVADGRRSFARYEYDDRILEQTWRSDEEGTLRTTAGPDGAFRLDGLHLDTDYEATASAPGHASSLPVRGIRVAVDGAARAVTLTLRRGASVLVRVNVPAGSAAPATSRVRLFLLPDDTMRKPAGRDPDGRYRFEDLDPGSARAFAQSEGFRSAVADVVLVEGKVAEADLLLEAGGAVEGVVEDADGKPLEGAEVAVASAEDNVGNSRYLSGAHKGKTDARGQFSIGGLSPGDAVLAATWSDWKAGRHFGTRGHVAVVVPARGVRVALARLASARMRLLTPDGRPFVGNAWIYAITSDGSGGWGGEIEQGRIESSRLDDGEHAILVAPAEYAWVRRSFVVREGADVDFGDVTLDVGVTVSGRVEDAAHAPVAGAKVTFVQNENRSVETDAAGRFALDRVPREPVTLRVEAEGCTSTDVAVEPSRTTNLEIHIGRPAKVHGTVKTAAGAPRETSISLRSPGAVLKHGSAVGLDGKRMEYDFYEGAEGFASDATGRFEIELSPGRWIGWWTDEAGQERKIGEWTFTDGETRELEIVLPAK